MRFRYLMPVDKWSMSLLNKDAKGEARVVRSVLCNKE
jgi:hypothetical protein